VLGTISVVISSILGNLIFNENYSYKIIIGIVLILSAIVFVNLKKKQKIDKYNIYAIVGGIFYGFAFTIDKSFVIDLSPFMYLGLMCLAVAVVSLIISFKKITRESKKIDVKSTYPMISAAIFGSAFNIFTFFAYRNGGSVGVVDAINNISIFLVIILEIILLKDRKNLFKKILASILAIGGVVLIAIA
jgi:drug/metabolite transporter (DMT)-like permease